MFEDIVCRERRVLVDGDFGINIYKTYAGVRAQVGAFTAGLLTCGGFIVLDGYGGGIISSFVTGYYSTLVIPVLEKSRFSFPLCHTHLILRQRPITYQYSLIPITISYSIQP